MMVMVSPWKRSIRRVLPCFLSVPDAAKLLGVSPERFAREAQGSSRVRVQPLRIPVETLQHHMPRRLQYAYNFGGDSKKKPCVPDGIRNRVTDVKVRLSIVHHCPLSNKSDASSTAVHPLK